MAVEKATRVLLASIIADPGVQPRASIDADTVAEYAEAIARGDTLPPLVVYQPPTDATTYRLACGFHRHAAYLSLDRPPKYVRCVVRQGDHDDAAEYALLANAHNGQRLTRADKRAAVHKAMAHPRLREHSAPRLAALIGVSAYHAELFRSEWLAQNAPSSDPTSLSKFDSETAPEADHTVDATNGQRVTYVDRHGNESTMDTSKIGRHQRSARGVGPGDDGATSPPPPPVQPRRPKVVTDALGAVLTGEVAEAFGPDAMDLAVEAQRAYRALVDVLERWAAHPSGRDLLAHHLQPQRTPEGETVRRHPDLTQVGRHLRACRPAVGCCPHCVRHGSPRPACKACRGQGWISAGHWATLQQAGADRDLVALVEEWAAQHRRPGEGVGGE